MEKWVLYSLGSAFFAALTAIFGKIGVEHINSNLATLIRTCVIILILVAMVSFKHDWQSVSSIKPQTWLFLALSGAATGLSWMCYYRALQLGEVAKVAPIDKLSVIFVIIFGVVFLGERLSLANFIGGLMITGGAIIMILF